MNSIVRAKCVQFSMYMRDRTDSALTKSKCIVRYEMPSGNCMEVMHSNEVKRYGQLSTQVTTANIKPEPLGVARR